MLHKRLTLIPINVMHHYAPLLTPPCPDMRAGACDGRVKNEVLVKIQIILVPVSPKTYLILIFLFPNYIIVIGIHNSLCKPNTGPKPIG